MEKRYGAMINEIFTLEELFAEKIKRTDSLPKSKLDNDELMLRIWLDNALPPYSPPGHIRKVLKAFKRHTDEEGFESVKYLLKRRGIKAEDYLAD
ncbi:MULTISPECIES: hypothetical protein [unclassified Neisseria]|uniref:hypothetical protein n=1 Tax=unclassified Neisseria TaxID=2623750 RepID=UPI00107220CB|nr:MULTISPECIES: hypothetical protein [unclassified Neisseria]MBF0804651.1 hypothetical protein [Neisseria sp. 19428wB4_WF04]TFU40319.1 hypothetical protein E4T99_09910 [Neisseria sp. WF04]